MQSDPIIPIFVTSIFFILALGVLMRRLRQPYVVVYLLAGVVLGPFVLGVIKDQAILSRLGSFGVLFLMFFIGMEVTPKRLIENWMIPIVGTILQVFVSVGVAYLAGWFFGWPLSAVVLLGFVISLSSTVVVLKLLEDWKEINTRVGQDVVGILLVQDLLIVPMMITLGFFSGKEPNARVLMLQIIGGVSIVGLSAWLIAKEQIKLSWLKFLGTDHEMQVFVALGICFGMAMLTGLLQLSSALGAFIAGMIISSAKETHWVHESLLTVRTIFIAVFFVSIGMLIDIPFIMDYWWEISILLVATYVVNTSINAVILKMLGEKWSTSLYGGSLLSQIGEFSFVLILFGFELGIIDLNSYRLMIAVISLSLLLSPLWIGITKTMTRIKESGLKRA